MGSCTIISEWNALRYDPGRIVQIKVTEFCSASDCVGFVWSRNCSKQRKAELFTIDDSCKTSYSKLQGLERWNEDHSPRVKGKKAYIERKAGECFQWKAHGQCSKGDSCSFTWHSSLWKQWRRPETKGTIVFSCIPFEGKTDWRRGTKTLKRIRQQRGKLFRQKSEIPCRFKFCKTRHVSSGILPCVRITSMNKYVFFATNAISDLSRQKESPTKGQRKEVQKEQLRYWRSLYNWVVCLKNLVRESLFHVNLECWDRNTPSNSPRAPGTTSKFWKKKKGPSRGN